MKCITIGMQALVIFACTARSVIGVGAVPDRPRETVSSMTVEAHATQIESGLLYREFDRGRSSFDQLEVLDTLLRYGLSDGIELRLGIGGIISREQSGVNSDNGLADASLGTKIRLSEESGRRPETAAVASVSLPVGDREFTSDEVDPAVLIAMAHRLDSGATLGYNVGVIFETVEDEDGLEDTDSSLWFAAALERRFSPEVTGFAELFGARGLSADDDPVSLQGGILTELGSRLLWDVHAGFGLTNDADDYFIGTGLTFIP